MIEAVLDACLDDIQLRHATIADCLAKYPEYAEELEPLLQLAVAIQNVQEIKPSEKFKKKTRFRLSGESEANPGADDGQPHPGSRVFDGLADKSDRRV